MKYVNLVLVSHSRKIVEGLKELLNQVEPKVKIAASGGFDGDIGTNPMEIKAAIESVYSDKGVVLLFDLGSAWMNAELAIEMLDNLKAIKIVDAPLVEGSYAAVVASGLGKELEQVVATAEKVRAVTKINR
ncbi:dihydroxyacetone kinase phosphoryl donor subunit DhaM [Bacillus sp. FJAT-50079]|uniref:dihydroxyacetone kinase phosphoryl donor subunit DhaM n=1 Tax=Bacillus sp. FJAT-50079 TaxID=2833577 RepID=UPI001BC957CF|nr:dihydroxyacetone kinase phosphoryl donor subunit DhaM [Bacillus sp. FJAT-50079]MBS4210284.1 PTS-dependent dihydroxyacetone kinase phosphotransferase subunit DhaM [Bacillus sp. FJAT-50079]